MEGGETGSHHIARAAPQCGFVEVSVRDTVRGPRFKRTVVGDGFNAVVSGRHGVEGLGELDRFHAND